MKNNDENFKKFLSLREEKENFDNHFTVIENKDSKIQDSNIRVDLNCLYQHRVALTFIKQIYKYIVEVNPEIDPETISRDIKFLDVGSRLNEVVSFSQYFQGHHIECRLGEEYTEQPRYLTDMNLWLFDCEAQDLLKFYPPSSFQIITCLHTLEHFGLGRYGDKLDYYGDQRALKIFNELLEDNGFMILSVPYKMNNTAKIEYNNQRIYSTEVFDKMLKDAGFELLEYAQINPFLHLSTDEENKLMHMPVHKLKETNNENPRMHDGYKENIGVYVTISKKIKSL